MNDLETLRLNLLEIHGASLDPEETLVANDHGTRLYQSSKGFGRFWTCYYKFCNDEVRPHQLQKCLIHIEVVLEKQREIVTLHAKKYQEYLQLRLGGTHVNESDYHESRRGILDWSHATKFLKEPKIPLIQNMRAIIKLEGEEQGPLPLHLIGMRLTGVKMEKNAKETLIQWIKRAPKVRTLHRALKQLSSLVPDSDLPHFEINSILKGGDIFKRPDPKHLLWREENLYEGSSPDQEIELGEQIGKKGEGFDEQIFYAIKGKPDHLLMSSTNLALLETKKVVAEERSFGLKTPKFHLIDPEGRFAIIERFTLGLESIAWESTTSLTKNDKKRLNPIAHFVNWICQENILPSKLDVRNLMYDKDGVLRTVKIQEKDPFNYFIVEKFLSDTSKGNPIVFKYLMETSRIIYRRHFIFYKRLVNETLEFKKPELPSIFSPSEIEKARELSSRMLKLIDKFSSEQSLDKRVIAAKLIKIYAESGRVDFTENQFRSAF